MRFAQLVNHFGGSYRHFIVAMDNATEAFAKLDKSVDATLLTVAIQRGKLLVNARSFRKVLRDLKPDLLVTSNWGTIEWAFANLDGRVPHLHMEDGFGPEEANAQIARRVWMRRLVLRHSTVLLPSRRLFSIARDVWRLPQRCLIHVPNGVDCSRFSARRTPQIAADFGIDTAGPVIGTVSGLRAEKNISRLVDAFARVVQRLPAQLIIVGDGPEHANLVAQAVALGISDRVVFTGAFSKPELILPFFDVFALSSDTEQMPLSVLEAMAAGLPLAATDVGDLRYMLAPENHPYLVKTQAEPLSDAIMALLAEPVRARTIGQANAARASGLFDQELMFAAYRELFEGRRPRTPNS
ncbi:MAG TPA: glycosyltransferase family 4 protein [Micropepsaceae bacterium]|nr:glycosyltransferase family 4 protein [Micropepsaceae bacterium]